MKPYKLIYTAGPYRGKTENDVRLNVERAKWWAEALWRLGAVVICPHVNTYEMDQAITPQEFVARDLEIVRRCDAVFMLPGWIASEGARLEHSEARDAGKRVFFWDEMDPLREWLDERKR